MELLVHLHTFVREATPTKLAKMEKDLQTISLNQKKTQESALPSLDIPKELWKLIDYLFSFELGKENLFTDGDRSKRLMTSGSCWILEEESYGTIKEA